MIKSALKLADQGVIPDFMIRAGIRYLLKDRINQIKDSNQEEFVQSISKAELAHDTDKANEQHYEVPTSYFQLALGERLKYSSCFYKASENLDQAEINMLKLYQERAQLQDGQTILELGCGWGSACLYFAEKLPNSKIVGISNSNGQREYINQQIKERGITNLTIITADINHFEIDQKFDRIISIEMFEHLRNYGRLFQKISGWLKTDGKLFVHIFCHKEKSYLFETNDESDWMGKHFFTGGMMPSQGLFSTFNNDLIIKNHWEVNGKNYAKTAEDWYLNHIKNKNEILNIFKSVYSHEYKIWYNRWKIFYLACAELFKYKNGSEWFVSHYLFEKK